MDKPGYFAVIPAEVRYDDQIPANAKLLYGEISALLNREGYCFASNQYFADLYGWTTVSVARLITTLEKAGYIRRELERDDKGQTSQRKIRLFVANPDAQPVNKIVNPPQQFCGEGINKNVKDTNTSITNIERKENIKEKKGGRKTAPSEDFDPFPQVIAWIGVTFPEESRENKNRLYQAFVRFNDNRIDLKKPYKTAGAVTALTNKLIRYSKVNLEKMIELLDDAVDNGWQSVYLREQKAPDKPKSKGRVYECL